MSSSESDEAPLTATLTINTKYLRHGKRFAMVYVPETFLKPLSLVILQWGAFENKHDQLLEGIISVVKNLDVNYQQDPWINLAFPKRLAISRGLFENYLRQHEPLIAQELLGLTTQAKKIHKQRNILAHGFFTYTFKPGSSEIMNPRAINPRIDAEMPISFEILEGLYHEIAHLHAQYEQCFVRAGILILNEDHSIPDTDLILAGEGKPHHPLTIGREGRFLAK